MFEGHDHGDAEQLASQLPGPIADFLRRAVSHRSFGVEELFTDVRDREPIRLREAMEHANVICQVLAEALDWDGQALLRPRLPADWESLFSRPEDARSNLTAGPTGWDFQSDPGGVGSSHRSDQDASVVDEGVGSV